MATVVSVASKLTVILGRQPSVSVSEWVLTGWSWFHRANHNEIAGKNREIKSVNV